MFHGDMDGDGKVADLDISMMQKWLFSERIEVANITMVNRLDILKNTLAIDAGD